MTDTAPETCACCRLARPLQTCVSCEQGACKKCTEFLAPDQMMYLPENAERPAPGRYCNACFDETVAPALEEYERVLEIAKQIRVIPKTYKMRLMISKKSKELETAGPGPDRDELTLRMGFKAALEGYNALIQAEFTSEKLRNHAYQTSQWRGSAFFAQIDTTRLDREELQEEMYRIGH